MHGAYQLVVVVRVRKQKPSKSILTIKKRLLAAGRNLNISYSYQIRDPPSKQEPSIVFGSSSFQGSLESIALGQNMHSDPKRIEVDW